MQFEEMNLKQLAERMKSTREQLDDVKADSAALQKEWDSLRKKWLPEKMEEMGIESVRIEGVGTVSERTDAYCTTPAKNKQALMIWMIENGHEDLISETINASTLKAFMKEQILEGNDVPDEIVSFTPYTYVAITK